MNSNSHHDYLQHKELLPAEILLLRSLEDNDYCSFPKNSENKIRGSLLEDIIRGNQRTSIIPDKDLIIKGAFIIGDIDLCGCTIEKPIVFQQCKILGVLNFSKAKIIELILKGTLVEELNIGEINCLGNIILSYGFKTLHSVFAQGAKIGGQLGCSGGEFYGYPLAITLESAIITQAFFWRHIKGLWGALDLTNASVGLLVDDPDSWPKKGNLRLAGFTYDALGGNTNPNYYDRLDWLNRQYLPHLKEDFRPQPFEQLVKVLRESGRSDVAKNIAIAKLNRQRDANFFRRNPKLLDYRYQQANTQSILQKVIIQMHVDEEKKNIAGNLVINIIALSKWSLSVLFLIIAGYGYKPYRIIIWSSILVMFAAFVFSNHHINGYISNLNTANQSSFNGFAFALDTFVPVVNFREAESWVLVKSGDQLFQPVLIFYWVYIFIGWVFTAIFAASITGVIKK